jgi:hypothetical protein
MVREPRARRESTLRSRAFLATEAVMAIGLTVALAGLFAAATVHYATARREADTRRLLRLAAAGELERLRAGLPRAAALADAPPSSAPGGIALTTTVQPGEGVWRGLTRVRVVARKQMSGERRIEVEVVGYVAGMEGPP